jgi:hypothetical protein
VRPVPNSLTADRPLEIRREVTRSLHALLDEVRLARSAQQTEQHRRGITPDALSSARWATLRALQDYAAALEERHWPVPRQIQAELRLYTALCGVT